MERRMYLVGAASIIDNPWSMAIDRADKGGILLANALLERQHGHRPVTLVGWSWCDTTEDATRRPSAMIN